MIAVAGAAASALLLGVYALVDGGSFALGFVALVPWILGLERARGVGAVLGSAALLAMGMAATAFHWFPGAVSGYAGASPAAGWIALLALAPIVVEPQLLCAALARHLARRRGAAAAFVLVYTGAEWALPKLFADTLGVGLYPEASLRGAADLAGVRGLTLVVLVANEGVVALLRRRVRPALAAAALVAAAWTYGAWRQARVSREVAAAPTARAGIVQASIGKYDKLAAVQGTGAAVAAILDTHFELSERLLGEGPLDVILWPETMYPTTFGAPKSDEGAAFDRAIAGFVARHRVPLVFGAFDADAGGEYNAMFLLEPEGEGLDLAVYRKSLLFPMTERVPAWLDGGWLRARLPWAGRWRPGPGARALPLTLAGRERLVAPLICYEVTETGYVAAGARAGAELLVTLSNDAWFPTEDGPRLHLLTAAFRSVETRRPQLRATNSGLSALILPTGELVSVTGFGARAAIRVEVPLVAPADTLVVRFGDWAGAPCLAAGLLAVLWGIRRPRSVPR
jgi:apolipoprotein N-acyltransferase